MAMTAARTGADYIVTRNIKDYSHSKVKAVRPADFLLMLDNNKEKQN
ncbi:MAG: hypothetical protein IKF54_04195 [Eubacterium sp.]|nr:hypothetical protein [Eubacterium sp.]